MIGDIYQSAPLSSYQPSAEVCDLTEEVKRDYECGNEILNKPYLELNDRSIIEDENRGQMMMNAFVDTEVEDPNEAWKYRGTRSAARNKGITMHANLTANYLLPLFTAQNNSDEIDRDFSEVMRDIIEWMASPTNSNYQSSFLQVTMGSLSNPVTYLGAEYCEVMQKIRVKAADGKYTVKEILDEVLSGFNAPIYSSTQVLITNAYERNIQKQRRIIKRRYCEKEELEAKYGDHENWDLVKPGVRSIFNEETGLFYDVIDSEHEYLVAEEIALSRRDDSEIPFINGIYFGNESVEDNPIKHRDNRNAPKYNITPFGYSRIGEHFFYYKSMMNAVGWDNMLYDTMSEIVMNRAILEVEMPIAVSGSDEIDSEIIFPNSVVTLESPDAKVQSLIPNSNMSGGFAALREIEKSINEGTVSETVSGQLPDANQKAYTVAQAQQSSKILIKQVGKSIAQSIVEYGDLMKDIAINHITTPEVEMLVDGGMKLKYKSLLLQNKVIGGKAVDKKIKFDQSLIGMEMTPQDKELAEMKILEESGYPNNKTALVRVNPEMFAQFKYLTRCDIEEMFAKNNDYWQPTLISLKEKLANDPYTNQEALTKEIMQSFFNSRGDDFIQKKPVQAPPASPENSLTSALSTAGPTAEM